MNIIWKYGKIVKHLSNGKVVVLFFLYEALILSTCLLKLSASSD